MVRLPLRLFTAFLSCSIGGTRPAERGRVTLLRAPRSLVFRVALTLAALAALALGLRAAGEGEAFGQALRGLAPCVPALILIELGRVGADLLALRGLAGPGGRLLSWGEWVGLHLVAQAALVVLPAGRAFSETLKIARLGPRLGGARAAAVVATLHTATLGSIALVAVAAAGVAWRLGVPLVALPLGIHAAVCLVGALGLRMALRRAIVPRAVAGWLGGAEVMAGDLRREAGRLPRWPWAPLGFKLGNRAAQIAQFSLLIGAGWRTLGGSVLAAAMSTLGGAFDLSVASVGTSDAALAAVAPALALGVASMLAAVAALRVAQLTVSALGGLLVLHPLLKGMFR
jgi:hypothetical protein